MQHLGTWIHTKNPSHTWCQVKCWFFFNVLVSAGLSSRKTWAGFISSPCLTRAHSATQWTEEIQRKNVPADLFADLFFNSELAFTKDTTSSLIVNPSLRKVLVTNPPIYLRALKQAKSCHKLRWNMFHHDPDQDVSRLSCACTGEESDSEHSVSMFALTP